MADPFAVALDAQFRAPGSMAAVYIGADCRSLPIRVIRSQPDQVSRFGHSRVLQSTNAFDIRRGDVSRPEPGATLIVGNATSVVVHGMLVDGDRFELVGDPQLDVEGLTWTCGAVPE